MSPRAHAAGLAAVVGVVLADSSVVILALPDILDRFDVSIDDVTWVLTLFNLVLALAAVPAAYLARRHAPQVVCMAGIAVFAVASLACGLAGSFTMLLVARAVQALGGAAAVCAALELLPREVGSERRATAIWAGAGALGAAAGPAIGGALTETINWQAIFLAQVPIALVALVLVPRQATAPVDAPAGRPHVAANLALGLLSAALTAALFLIVLLLINGWGYSPLGAATIVSVMPLSSLVAYRLTPTDLPGRVRAACGAILVGGGLAALALIPDASPAWLVPPQVLIGTGLAFAIGALTEDALAGRSPLAIHGGWTIAARHAGVCLGLLLLTPIFTGDLESQQKAAEVAGARIVLDSQLSLSDKVDLGSRLEEAITGGSVTRPPDLSGAFTGPGDPGELARIRAAVTDVVERAVTHAFSRSFVVAALLALAALVPLWWGRKPQL
jgi:MFS family permease